MHLAADGLRRISMKPLLALTVVVTLLVLSVCAQEGADKVEGAEKKPQKRVFGKSDEVSYKGKVVVIKVGEKDLVNKHAFRFWRRVLQRVNDEQARAVVFDLNTPGGYALETAELIMVDMQKLRQR